MLLSTQKSLRKKGKYTCANGFPTKAIILFIIIISNLAESCTFADGHWNLKKAEF